MIGIAFTITQDMISDRKARKLSRKLTRQSLARIRDFYWPQHFERNHKTAPGGGYRYAKRSRKYQIWKAKKLGHQKPMVKSGRTRTAARRNAKISATFKGGRIRSKTHYKRTPERARELEAVTEVEEHEIAQRYGRDWLRLSKRPEYQTKHRRKVGA